MAPFLKETIAASKEFVNAVMEEAGCHDSACSWMLKVMEDDAFLKHQQAWSLIFTVRLEKHQHMLKNQCLKWCAAVGILDQLRCMWTGLCHEMLQEWAPLKPNAQTKVCTIFLKPTKSLLEGCHGLSW